MPILKQYNLNLKNKLDLLTKKFQKESKEINDKLLINEQIKNTHNCQVTNKFDRYFFSAKKEIKILNNFQFYSTNYPKVAFYFENENKDYKLFYDKQYYLIKIKDNERWMQAKEKQTVLDYEEEMKKDKIPQDLIKQIRVPLVNHISSLKLIIEEAPLYIEKLFTFI